MPSISGGFVTPSGQQVVGGGGQQREPGSITVFDWSKCIVLINKQVFTGMIDMSCTRSADLSAGSAQVRYKDSTKAIYNAINVGDEVEIYLSEQSPMLYANKVWGGFLENASFDVDTKIILTMKAKEYTQVMILQMTAASAVGSQNSFVNVEPGTAIKALMSTYQVDFTTDNVLTGTTSLLTADFLNQTLFDAVKKICDQFNYVFYVNLDKDMVVRRAATVVSTPASDFLTYGDNLYSIKEETNKELLCNDIIVYGKTNVFVSNGGAPLQDAASITAYGNHAKRLVISNLTTSADCTNFANAYLATYKEPVMQYKTDSRLIAFSDPLQYIPVICTQSAINGSFQIRELSHRYGKKGIMTEMTLSMKVSDLSISLGQLMNRVSAIEVKTFT